MALIDKLNNIGNAIRAKTGTTEKMTLDEMATAIEGISVGGGSVFKKDVNFYDYDGTLLHSYTVEEAQKLTELPELPTQEGLICQGWNWSLENIKTENGVVDVGATYITDDGKTRLYIEIREEDRMTPTLYFKQSAANSVTIDWGDGSSTETVANSGNVSISHTYAGVGNYIIALDVAAGRTIEVCSDSNKYAILGPLQVYSNMLKKAEIGNRASIGYHAFVKCYSLATVVIPKGASISSYAFSYCYTLKSVVIPDGITKVNHGLFNYCLALTSVAIPKSVTSIGQYIFYYCQALKSVVIPKSVTSIDYTNMFSGCNSLKSIAIPDGITVSQQPGNTFSYCYALKSVVVPGGITSINNSIFRNCSALTSVVIHDNVTYIGYMAFFSCHALTSVIIPDSVASIGSYAFEDCSSMSFYDFTNHTSVPTLSNTNAFNGIPSDCEIRVPAALYDKWIAATNWSSYAKYIVAV